MADPHTNTHTQNMNVAAHRRGSRGGGDRENGDAGSEGKKIMAKNLNNSRKWRERESEREGEGISVKTEMSEIFIILRSYFASM